MHWNIHRKTSNIRRNLVSNKIADHSDVVGASPVGIFIPHLTTGFNGLGKDNCKTRWETFKFWDLVWLILEVWWYVLIKLQKTGFSYPWWRYQMENISALLAICAGNSPVPGEFPTQRPVTWSFDVFFELRLNKRLSKQPWGWWFETLSCPLWNHRNAVGLESFKDTHWKHFYLPGHGKHMEEVKALKWLLN